MTTPQVIAPDPLAALAPPMRWLLTRAPLDEAALPLVDAGGTLESLYGACLANEHFSSAIRLIAGVLPTRESIWWAWVSARYATQADGGKAPTALEHDALTAVEQWVVRPDDAARRKAWDAGNLAGLDSPIGVVTAAVFLSGTTLGGPEGPPVPPPPGAAMRLVAGAIVLAGLSNSKSETIPRTLTAFAAQGLEIVKRLGGWDAALKLAYDTHQRAQAEYDRATAAPAAAAR